MTDFKIDDQVFHIASPQKTGTITAITGNHYIDITVHWDPPFYEIESKHPAINLRLLRRQAKTHQEHTIT